MGGLLLRQSRQRRPLPPRAHCWGSSEVAAFALILRGAPARVTWFRATVEGAPLIPARPPTLLPRRGPSGVSGRVTPNFLPPPRLHAPALRLPASPAAGSLNCGKLLGPG